MNNLYKIIFSCFALFFTAGNLFGQNLSSSSKGLPLPPYLKEAPAMSRWTIQFIPLSGSGDPTSKGGEGIRQINVTRTHQLRCVVVVHNSGETQELWSNGNCFVENATKWPSPIIVNSSQLSAEGSVLMEYQLSDFPDYRWVSKETYSETVQLDGRACLVFKKPTSQGAKETTTAWIDEATRLPVQCVRNNVIRKIVFSDPPSDVLVFPPKVAEIVRQMNRLMEITNMRAPQGG